MFLRWAHLRPRLIGSLIVAVIVFLLLPSSWHTNARLLVSWDMGVAVYLVNVASLATTSTLETMRKRAGLEDEGALAILVLTVTAAIASLAAIAIELLGIHQEAVADQAFRLSVAGVTILCSWFFVHTIWAIHYAHEFYGDEGERRGLHFPSEDSPDYWDFMYFSFNMGAAAQTSDVTIVSRKMRRLVLSHTILAFLFNTMILALAVNVGASLI